MAKEKTELGISHLGDDKLDSLRNQLQSFVSGASTTSTVDDSVEEPIDSHSSHTDTDGWI